MGDIGKPVERGAHRPVPEVTVLVTGFGSFLDRFPINSSWVICSSLPEYLPGSESCPSIRIIKHKEPIRVAYHSAAELVPRLLAEAEPKPDIVLHLGLAAKFPRRKFAMERQSKRGVYGKEKDVDGRVFAIEEDEKLWHGFPQVLKPTFDLDDVYRRWKQHIGASDDIDPRASDDPGAFLCGFTYYSSLAGYHAQNSQAKERPVMFLHVPDLPTKEDIDVGIKAAVALIQALAESRKVRGTVDPLKDSAALAKDMMTGAET